MKAKKSDDTPLPGETVDAAVTLFNNEPPTSEVGYFMPARGVTDENGVAEFLFVIHKGMVPGPLELSFFLTAYLEANGDPVRVRSTGRIREPVLPGRGRVAEIESGQGQIAIPGVRINKPLGVRFLHDPDYSIPPETYVAFQFIEGSGRITVVDGAVHREFANDGGKAGVILIGVTGASVKVTLDPGVKLALVDVGPASDVFAIGTPEARLVLAEDPSVGTSGFVANPIETPDPASRFLLECRMPVSGVDEVKAEVESFDLCDRRLELEGAVAPTRIVDVAMTAVEVDPEERFTVYRSSADRPFMATDSVTLPGGPTPTLPGNLTPIQALRGGALSVAFSVEYTAGTFRFLPPPPPEISIQADDFFIIQGQTVHFSVRRGQSALPTTFDREWTLRLSDSEPIVLNRIGSLFVKFVDDVTDLSPDGINSETALVLRVAESIPNRRRTVTVSAHRLGTPDITPPRDFFIALTKSALPGDHIVQAAELPQRYTEYVTRENDFASPEDYTPAQWLAIVADANRQFGPGVVGPGTRIGFSLQANETALADTLIVIGVEGNVLTGAGLAFTFRPFGTVVRPLGQPLADVDLDGVILHELYHVVEHGFLGSTHLLARGVTYSRLIEDFMLTNYYNRPGERNGTRFREVFLAGQKVIEAFKELEAYAYELSQAFARGGVSNFRIEALTRIVPSRFNDVMNLLRAGRFEAFSNNLVDEFLPRIHRELPSQLRDMKGPAISITSPTFDSELKKLSNRTVIFPLR